jgi:hypothetical protein
LRLQPVEIGLGYPSATDSRLLKLSYGYGPADQNNGNIVSQTIYLAGATATQPAKLNVKQTYTYDDVNRLSRPRKRTT